MKWFRNALKLLSPEEQLDAEIGDTLLHLRSLLDDAEAQGLHFRPSARLARTALRSIWWK